MKLVERQGRRILARQVDVRDPEAVDAVVADGVAEFGRLDIVIANAGIIRVSDSDDPRRTFRDVVEVNLIGVWNTVDAAIPAMIAGGRGGSIVLASSTQGIKASGTDRAPGSRAMPRPSAAWSRLLQGWAAQLAPHSIRVNTIHPSGVATDMIINETTMALAAAGDPWLADQQNALPIALLQPEQIADRGGVAGLRRRGVHHRHVVAAGRRIHTALRDVRARGRRTGPKVRTGPGARPSEYLDRASFRWRATPSCDGQYIEIAMLVNRLAMPGETPLVPPIWDATPAKFPPGLREHRADGLRHGHRHVRIGVRTHRNW